MTSITLFQTDLVLRITGASANQLKYWVKIGLVAPIKEGKRYLFTFRDIIRIRVIRKLKDQGLSLQKIRKGIDNLSKVLPADDDPLARLIILTDGLEMIAMEKGMYFSATSMQRYLQFDVEELHTSAIRFQTQEAIKTAASARSVSAG